MCALKKNFLSGNILSLMLAKIGIDIAIKIVKLGKRLILIKMAVYDDEESK